MNFEYETSFVSKFFEGYFFYIGYSDSKVTVMIESPKCRLLGIHSDISSSGHAAIELL